MREHEVPTHVQAEDKVLLGFTFPQIVAVTAVCAISYGAYRYAPVGPSEVRMALAVVLGLVGLAMVVGKIGGRRLPLVAADLLKYRLGARVYAGPVAQLVRAETPAPPHPVKSGPGPLSLMAKRAGRGLGRLRKNRKTRKNKERRNGRMRWFGKRRGKDAGNRSGQGHKAETLQSRRRKPRMGWIPVVALAVLMAAVVAVPESALADGHEPWRNEIDFEVTEPVPGRRIFVEALTVSGDRAAVTFGAATALDIRVRAFGGPEGTWLRFWGSATLAEGERIDYSLPLHGPAPSFTVSWEDTLGQAGAVTFEEAQLPFPLPVVEGDLCDLRVTSLGWTPGAVSGVVESECVTRIEHPVELQTVAGHDDVIQTALMDAGVTAIVGTLSAATGASQASVPFVPNGETRFTLPIGDGQAIHAVSVDVSLEASLRIPIPPLTVLTHHPERTEQVTRTVHLHRPGDSDSDSETATATCEDGATASATATAYAYVPSATIAREVTVDVLHKEHVKAETVEREPVTRTREESLSLAAAVGSDDPFAVLVLPEPEPEDPPAEQEPADGLRAGSTCWDGSGPGEAGDGPAAADRRGPRLHGGLAGRGSDASRLRPRAHGDGLRRLRPLPLRHRLGRVRPDGRGRRGARRRTGQGRRRHGGRRPGAGALGQGRRRPAEARHHPIPPNTLEKRKLST